MRQIFRTFQSGRAYRYSGFGNGPNGPNGPNGSGGDVALTIIFILGTYIASKRK